MADLKKVLLINPFGIGDVLFTTPLIRIFKERFPLASVCYWCNERVGEILSSNQSIDQIFALSRGDIKKIYRKSKIKGIRELKRLFSEIKKERFDVSLDVSLDSRYGLISWLAGIKKRIGLNYKNRGRFLTHKIDICGFEKKHVVEYYLDLLKFLDIKISGLPKLELCLSKEDKDWAAEFLRENNIDEKDLLIGIVPGGGASWGRDAVIKHWPAENFAKIADRCMEKFGAKIIIFGDHSDFGACEKIYKTVKGQIIQTCGKTNLRQFCALLGKCRLVIANDGGPLHIAVAMGAKTVSLFGPVDEKVYGPYPNDPKRHIVIKKELNCRPCYKGFKMADCKRRICLEEINPEEVFQAVEELI